ncbi:hypothetical protein CCHOA_08500 [Corynebacterium choanae]|uniref:Uncharacterized protein n=1 Tax=Corynebacterium choanae TaxID=1862358 RepID=A0A3G6J857_9CORY|nr:hypothetical protein CCHOA_08500 [Corynebacterium choanae]
MSPMVGGAWHAFSTMCSPPVAGIDDRLLNIAAKVSAAIATPATPTRTSALWLGQRVSGLVMIGQLGGRRLAA